MPRKLWFKRRTVIGLNFLNGEWEMLPDLLWEVDGSLGVVVIRDAHNAKSGRFVNGRELIKALTRSSHTLNEFYIELTERPGTWRGA